MIGDNMEIQNKDVTELIRDVNNLRWRARNHYASFMIGKNDDLGVKLMEFARGYNSLLDDKNDCMIRYCRLNNKTMTCEFHVLVDGKRINDDPLKGINTLLIEIDETIQKIHASTWCQILAEAQARVSFDNKTL